MAWKLKRLRNADLTGARVQQQSRTSPWCVLIFLPLAPPPHSLHHLEEARVVLEAAPLALDISATGVVCPLDLPTGPGSMREATVGWVGLKSMTQTMHLPIHGQCSTLLHVWVGARYAKEHERAVVAIIPRGAAGEGSAKWWRWGRKESALCLIHRLGTVVPLKGSHSIWLRITILERTSFLTPWMCTVTMKRGTYLSRNACCRWTVSFIVFREILFVLSSEYSLLMWKRCSALSEVDWVEIFITWFGNH